MAQRPAWTIEDDKVVCKFFPFEWNGGFAISQKQKNIANLHCSIQRVTNETALEVSSKSTIPLGRDIGAFLLRYNGISLENIFQSSKKFEKGGPYLDLLTVAPKDAKRDERIRNSGRIVSFCLDGKEWPTEPKTLFYDYIYVKALVQNYGLNLELSGYDWFTDIEFNPNRSINCQARSATIYKLLQMKNMFGVLEESNGDWVDFHRTFVQN